MAILGPSPEIERLERIVHDRRHFAELAAHQFLNGGSSIGIRSRRLRQLSRKFIKTVNHNERTTRPLRASVPFFLEISERRDFPYSFISFQVGLNPV